MDSHVIVASVSTVISATVSVLATWYFSKRHYSRARRPVTDADVAMEKVKSEHREKLAGTLWFPVIAAISISVIGLSQCFSP